MKRYDDIEQLFRNRLHEEDMESGDWLTPPNFILENASKIVNERKKKRRRGFIILFFGLAAAGFIAIQTLGPNKEVLSVTESTLVTETSDLETTSIDEKINTIAKDNENQETLSEDTNNNLTDTEQLSAASNNPNAPSRIINSGLISEKHSRDFNHVINTASGQDLNKSLVNDEKAIDTKSVHAQAQSLQEISSVEISELQWESPYVSNDLPLAENKIEEEKKGMELYAFGGSNLSTLDMTNVVPSDFELTEYDNFYLGYQLGLGYDYRINQKWSLTATVSYNSFMNKSSYLRNELYDKSNEETEIDGSISYRSSFDISTPLTETSKEFIIDVDDYSVEQDHILVNSTEIKERINVLRTSVGLRYDMARINKLGFGISAGISANMVFGLNNNYKSTVSYEDVKMMEKEFNSEESSMLKNVFLSSYVSAGVDYSINARWSATLNTGYERSIGSIRKADPSNPTKTMLGSIGLNVGLRHLF